jgi:hypothetical protein
MSVIKLEIPDKLAEKLVPYRDQLVELLELGLQKWQEREQQEHQSEQERIYQILAASGKVTLPKPYTGEKFLLLENRQVKLSLSNGGLYNDFTTWRSFLS